MILRFRNKAGTWRLEVDNKTTTSEIVARLEHEHNVKVTSLSLKPDNSESFHDKPTTTVASLNLKHGSLLYLTFTGVAIVETGQTKKSVDSHGNVVASQKVADKKSFRPGLTSLRSQKLHWSLTDMVELDDQYTFDIKGEQLTFCSEVSLDSEICNNFQTYCRKMAFQQPRCGYLYGRYVDSAAKVAKDEKEKAISAKPAVYGATKSKMKLSDLDISEDVKPQQGVRVEAIYEPKQNVKPYGFEIEEDPRESAVDTIAKSLGLQRVGFIFSHPNRTGYTFSTNEIVNAGEQALHATNGQFDTAFVVVKVFPDDQGQTAFEAFSLTPQCLEMVAEGALLSMVNNPGHSAVHETFTAVVEKKAATVIDNDFFIKRVPILQHTSKLKSEFPRYNRANDLILPSNDELKRVLKSKLKKNPSNNDLTVALGDFHLLVFLSTIFDVSDLLEICKSVGSTVFAADNPDEFAQGVLPLQDGYKLMILSMCELMD